MRMLELVLSREQVGEQILVTNDLVVFSFSGLWKKYTQPKILVNFEAEVS